MTLPELSEQCGRKNNSVARTLAQYRDEEIPGLEIDRVRRPNGTAGRIRAVRLTGDGGAFFQWLLQRSQQAAKQHGGQFVTHAS